MFGWVIQAIDLELARIGSGRPRRPNQGIWAGRPRRIAVRTMPVHVREGFGSFILALDGVIVSTSAISILVAGNTNGKSQSRRRKEKKERKKKRVSHIGTVANSLGGQLGKGFVIVVVFDRRVYYVM